MTTHTTWTAAQVKALGVTTDITTAAEILGIARSTAYAHIQDGTFPVSLILTGHRKIVPVAALLRLLLLDDPTNPGKPEAEQPDDGPT